MGEYAGSLSGFSEAAINAHIKMCKAIIITEQEEMTYEINPQKENCVKNIDSKLLDEIL